MTFDISENQVALACSVLVLDFLINGPSGKGGPLKPSASSDPEMRKLLTSLSKNTRQIRQYYLKGNHHSPDVKESISILQDTSLERLESLTDFAKLIYNCDDLQHEFISQELTRLSKVIA